MSRPSPDDDDACDDRHERHQDECAATDPKAIERAAELFRALGDPARLRLLERLAKGERCVTELAVESGDQLSTVSQRLRSLRSVRLVRRRRQGKHIHYSLVDDHVADVIAKVLAHVQEPADAGDDPNADP